MFIDVVPNRGSPPAILLRESWREGKKTHKRTVANLSKLPPEAVEALRLVLKGQTLVPAGEAVQIERSLPHGHVAAVLGSLRKIGLERVLASRPCRERDLVVAMIVARILDPLSKLATARGLEEETAFTSLAETLGVQSASADELYAAMDWLIERQERIEAKLAAQHLEDGTLVLYDVSSTYFEGRHCPLAAFGHNRDKKKGKRQIVFGLLTTAEGCPVGVEVFPGNTSDPATLGAAIEKLRGRFGLSRIVMVADRGMLTEARITKEVRPAGLEWVTALRSEQIRDLVEGGELQLSLFDRQDLGEITAKAYPGERLIACKNPLLEAERARKRQDLLEATERELDRIVAATRRTLRRLRGKDNIGVRLGRVLGRFKMAKHFRYEITEESFAFARDEESIRREAALDGIYVIRTSVEREVFDAEQTVGTYKSLSRIERAFRCQKTIDLEVRPIRHRREERVRAHIFLCMLAYYVEWHMRRALAPILFDDHDREGAAAKRTSPVAAAERSDAAKRKATRGRTEDGLPVHSFQTLLKDLATLCRNRVRVAGSSFDQITHPTKVQTRALELLQVKL
jgi:hypothetical protein